MPHLAVDVRHQQEPLEVPARRDVVGLTEQRPADHAEVLDPRVEDARRVAALGARARRMLVGKPVGITR